MISIGWPEAILLTLYALGFAITCEEAGKPRGPYKPSTTLASIVISLGLLYWGGFFS